MTTFLDLMERIPTILNIIIVIALSIAFVALVYLTVNYAETINVSIGGVFVLKAILASLPPIICLMEHIVGGFESDTLINIVTYISLFIILLMNLKRYGLKYGLVCTLAYGIYTFVMSFGIVYLIIGLIVAAILFYLFGGSLGKSDSNYNDSSFQTSSHIPGSVVDVRTNQSFRVEPSINNDNLYLPERDNAIIKPSDFSGRYIDNYGNEYIES
ncbi:MAG: hypothetical protein NC122_04840 [Faecalibacterium sp.]|nr:hypothetical protein [Ruminococcus sp.]MCM1391524.1 hypothetical protein [Ruminococcus sp.]MCM1485512.1 hypothetical protein [Faecalibacterium sp.]